METRHVFRIVLVASASIILGAASATAAVRFVDGACATSGSGASITCGASGPFRTIAEGVLAMQPGDRLNVRGAHAGFDGVYFESLELRNNAPLPGKALACSAGARCVIQGCRVPDCPADEVPTIRGMQLRSWTNLGGGVYGRAMEGSPNQDLLPPLERDNFDPGMLIQGTSYPLTPLGYAGDSVGTPEEGKWSYLPASHEIRVNPIGGADPAATVYVPHFGVGVYVAEPSSYVTLAYLAFEGSRQKPVQIEAVTGLTLSHIRASYWNEHGVHSSRGAPGLLIEDSILEYGGRGISWAASNSDGAFAVRLFGAHGGAIRRNIIRHVGSSGEIRLSCGAGCTNAWACETCDAPWNQRTQTHISTSGIAYQVKQTEGFTLEDNLAEDIGTSGMDFDTSRHVVARRNTLRRTGSGFGVSNYTPTSGCPTTSTSQFCYSCDNDFTGNTIEDSGGPLFTVNGSADYCSINIGALTATQDNCTYVAHIMSNTIVRPRTQPVCGTSSALITIASNTVTDGGNTTSTTTSTSTTSTASSPSTSSTTTTRPTSTTVRPTSTTSSTTNTSTTSTTGPTTPTTSTSSTTNTSVTTTTLVGSDCGNGVLDAGEECDDGNLDALDGCDGLCLLEEVAASVSSYSLSTSITPPDDPVGAKVVSPTRGRFVIVETSTTTAAPEAFTFVRRQVHMEGSQGRPAVPLRLTFTLNGALAPSVKHPRYLKLFLDGRLVGPCIVPRRAFPDPCVVARVPLDDQNVDVAVLTSTTGEWNFGILMQTTNPTVDRCLGGTKLMILDNPSAPEKRRFLLRSHDTPELVVGDGTDALAAIAQGGTLHVAAVGGDLFDATYDLPAEGWEPINPRNPAYGVRYRDDVGPIRSVVFKGARSLQVIGLGAELQQTLNFEPDMVQVELTLGQYVYMLEFGGEQQQFEPSKKLLRKWSSRPAICPSDGTSAP